MTDGPQGATTSATTAASTAEGSKPKGLARWKSIRSNALRSRLVCSSWYSSSPCLCRIQVQKRLQKVWLLCLLVTRATCSWLPPTLVPL